MIKKKLQYLYHEEKLFVADGKEKFEKKFKFIACQCNAEVFKTTQVCAPSIRGSFTWFLEQTTTINNASLSLNQFSFIASTVREGCTSFPRFSLEMDVRNV